MPPMKAEYGAEHASGRARALADRDQALEGAPVRQEFIDNQNVVAWRQEALAHDDGKLALLRKRVDGGRILLAIKVDGLRLLGEHDRRVAEMARR